MSEAREKTEKCIICGKPSRTTICHACEDKIRSEAVDKKIRQEKAGRTDKEKK